MIIDRMLRGLDSLGIGGDDYLVKPFAFAELLARVNALVRRPPMATIETTLRVADLETDLMKRAISRASRRVDLQHEFRQPSTSTAFSSR